MPKSKDSKLQPRLAKLIKLLQADTLGDYERTARRLRLARETLHEEVAHQLEPVLNQHVQDMPKESFEEKRDLSRWLNAELRNQGLAIRCPKTGKPAMLFADAGHDPSTGRFQLTLISDQDGRRRTKSSSELSEFELLAHFDRREPLSEFWSSRIKGTKDREPKRS